jgi:hypothetical protein
MGKPTLTLDGKLDTTPTLRRGPNVSLGREIPLLKADILFYNLISILALAVRFI